MKKAIILLLASMTVLTACDYGSDLAIGGTEGTTSGSTPAQTAETTMWHCGLTEADPTEDSVSYALPRADCIPNGKKVTGKMPGTDVYLPEAGGEIDYDFVIRTVVHAEVIEVLPDSYYTPSRDLRYFVAKLRVLDPIRGEKMPEEIFLRYYGGDRDVIVPYESLILSMEQIGVENYMLINDTQGSYEYFPHMFQTADGGHIDLGSVIAFQDGTVVDGYEFNHNHIADPGATAEAVKERILAVADGSMNDYHYSTYYLNLPCDYLTAEDFFNTEEAKQVQAEVAPGGDDVYMQSVYAGEYYSDWNDESSKYMRLSVTYTRVINGFAADERVCVSKAIGKEAVVEWSDVRYSPDDLASVPDIAAVLTQMDAAEVLLSDKNSYPEWQFRAMGSYVKENDEVYGMIYILWDGSGGCIVQYVDFCLRYDSEGIGSIVE